MLANQGFGTLGLNTAVVPSHRPGRKLRIGTVEYEHGLGMHAQGVVAIDLGGEFRYIRQVDLQFADAAAVPDGVQLQAWTGSSSWQGSWRTLDVPIEKKEGRWSWQLSYQQSRQPTDKIRWISSGARVQEERYLITKAKSWKPVRNGFLWDHRRFLVSSDSCWG